MRHRQAAFARVGWGVLLAVWLPCALGAAPAPLPGPLELEDPIAPLTPVKPRTEAEQDHLDALAHFAAGRVAVQREDHATALREYQRAARLDPDADYVLREIVPLAFELNRPAIAVRYA